MRPLPVTIPHALLCLVLLGAPPAGADPGDIHPHAIAPLAIQPRGEATRLYFDRAQAEAARAALERPARVETVTIERYLTTLSLVFADHRAARRALRRLRSHGIDAFLRRYRLGGWIVHAGAHADPRLSEERRAFLRRLGYTQVLVGEVRRPVTAYRLVPLLTDDLPRPSLPLRLSLSAENQARRWDNRWVNDRRLQAKLRSHARRGGWEAVFDLQLRGWIDAERPEDTYLRPTLGPTYLRHRGADGEWRLGLIDPADDDPTPTRGLVRPDLSAPPPFRTTRPIPAVQWAKESEHNRLTLLWSPWFLPAYDPGPWRPLDRSRGRLLGLRLDAPLRTVVQQGEVAAEANLHGGFQATWERRRGGARQRFVIAYDRPPLPYYRIDPSLAAQLRQGVPPETALAAMEGPALSPIHPPGWSVGLQERALRWHWESAFSTDVPYTATDYRLGYTTALRWRFAFTPRIRNITRLHLELSGRRLTTDAPLLDRRTPSRVGVRLERRLTHRLRARTDFKVGLDQPELLFTSTLTLRPGRGHRLDLGARIYAGGEGTLGGQFASRSHVALSWHLKEGP